MKILADNLKNQAKAFLDMYDAKTAAKRVVTPAAVMTAIRTTKPVGVVAERGVLVPLLVSRGRGRY